jgi:hypothetical protein
MWPQPPTYGPGFFKYGIGHRRCAVGPPPHGVAPVNSEWLPSRHGHGSPTSGDSSDRTGTARPDSALDRSDAHLDEGDAEPCDAIVDAGARGAHAGDCRTERGDSDPDADGYGADIGSRGADASRSDTDPGSAAAESAKADTLSNYWSAARAEADARPGHPSVRPASGGPRPVSTVSKLGYGFAASAPTGRDGCSGCAVPAARELKAGSDGTDLGGGGAQCAGLCLESAAPGAEAVLRVQDWVRRRVCPAPDGVVPSAGRMDPAIRDASAVAGRAEPDNRHPVPDNRRVAEARRGVSWAGSERVLASRRVLADRSRSEAASPCADLVQRRAESVGRGASLVWPGGDLVPSGGSLVWPRESLGGSDCDLRAIRAFPFSHKEVSPLG